MAVEMSWPIGYLMVRKLDTDLWEVRTGIPTKGFAESCSL